MRWAYALGGSLLVLGFLAGFGVDRVVQEIDRRVESAISEQVIWRPDSPPSVHDRYAATNASVHVRYYFFSITNIVDVRAGAKPVLEEIGPFIYTKHAIKQGITFLNGTVSFHDYTYYLPCPELTPLSLDTPITTLNLPLVGALEKIGGYAPASAARWLSWLARAVEAWSGADVEGLFTTRSARELLWGYDDPLLKRLHWFAPGLDPHFTIVHNISGAAAAATRPVNVMATGARDPREVWQAREWRGLTRVTAWAPPHVERVRGGDGLQFQPGVTLGQSHVVWVGEAFRAATLLAQEETSLHGVPLIRLRTDPHQGDINPTYFQYIQGLMNITGPMASGRQRVAGGVGKRVFWGPLGQAGKTGPPLFLSMPHYCGADPALAAGVVGLKCDPARHKLHLDVEPHTGITVRGARRIQLSSWFGPRWKPIDGGVTPTYLPIFWADEASEASEEQMQLFKPLLRADQARALLNHWHWHLVAALTTAGAALLVLAATLTPPEEAGVTRAGALPSRVTTGEVDMEAVPLLDQGPEEIQPVVVPGSP
ncbi:Scavenger receptor class B member 1 [Auxenochlorella protothecoides]|uniref:Scavenger receptor class B member 1 n=1 Tax=Auxenochlorella protothecoides TaxID=3075 RepID=A0A087SIC5_AUXPR|nr:Scavenger receptor class B member 1 [Auxenochlorella protothecoides]KFM25479.1 Scavenger receptor class B member 1 [Auxenochlorella protothecoides]